MFLTDVQKLHDNLDRTKQEAKSALEAKKRMLIQAIERRYDEALEAVDDEVQAKKLPLEQAAGDIKRSSAVLEAALETLEDKLKEPQQDFIQRFVPMIEVCHLPLVFGQNRASSTCNSNSMLQHIWGRGTGYIVTMLVQQHALMCFRTLSHMWDMRCH